MQVKRGIYIYIYIYIYIWLYGGPCGQWPDACQPCGLGSGWGEILQPSKADPETQFAALGHKE